jgi:hypothetical protein
LDLQQGDGRHSSGLVMKNPGILAKSFGRTCQPDEKVGVQEAPHLCLTGLSLPEAVQSQLH